MSDALNPFANVKIAATPKKDNQAAVTDPFAVEQGSGAPNPSEVPLKAPAEPSRNTVQPHVREKIKEAAIEQGYRSDSRPKKETTKTFAYTFYPSDIKSIRRIKMTVMEDDITVNISDSEVMRAAISALKSLSYDEQKRFILDQKER